MEKAAFLGPKAENVDELERLLLEVLHDHAFWRRNFHPADPRLIAETDKRSVAYSDATAHLRDELFQILAELKRGAPLFSPRQIGHMVTDPTLPALVGYFAGMLYNQNNVVAEAAPETVRKEQSFMAALARMIGYPEMLPERLPSDSGSTRAPFSWGHLSSGGTAANIEALWIARNVRLYPLAIRLLAATQSAFGELGELTVAPAGTDIPAPLHSLRTFELLNIPIGRVADLHATVRARVIQGGPQRAAAFEKALPSVRKVGLAGLITRYNACFPTDPLKPPVALVSRAAHYGWGKGMDVVGLGADGLRLLPVDQRFRLDLDALQDGLDSAAAAEEAVLMVIGIMGTTEEGAVDPLHHIDALRSDMYHAGVTYWHHADGAFGGYLSSAIPRDAAGRALPYDPQREELLSADVYRAVAAAAQTDSITLDPHKWGFVPYPAGAVLFRDYRVRDAIGYAAPYLPTEDRTGFGGFLGRWTLEGSRPGAPAVSAYLSQTVVPLDDSGHGVFVRDGIAAARAIVESLEDRFQEGPLQFRLVAEPDTVGFCFVLTPRTSTISVAEQNALTRKLWTRLNVDGREDVGSYRYILSKTELDVAAYRDVLQRMLGPDAILEDDDDPVMLLRGFVLNPFVATWNRRTPSFADTFAEHLATVAESIYPASVGSNGQCASTVGIGG